MPKERCRSPQCGYFSMEDGFCNGHSPDTNIEEVTKLKKRIEEIENQVGRAKYVIHSVLYKRKTPFYDW